MKSIVKRVQSAIEPVHRSAKSNGSKLLPRWHGEIDAAFERMFNRMRSEFAPLGTITSSWASSELTEDEKQINVRVDAPGLEPKDIDVEISGNLLVIKGFRNAETRQTKRGAEHHEKIVGSFYRAIPLPDYADLGKIEAHYDKGVLTVTIAKQPGKGPKKVMIEAV